MSLDAMYQAVISHVQDHKDIGYETYYRLVISNAEAVKPILRDMLFQIGDEALEDQYISTLEAIAGEKYVPLLLDPGILYRFDEFSEFIHDTDLEPMAAREEFMNRYNDIVTVYRGYQVVNSDDLTISNLANIVNKYVNSYAKGAKLERETRHNKRHHYLPLFGSVSEAIILHFGAWKLTDKSPFISVSEYPRTVAEAVFRDRSWDCKNEMLVVARFDMPRYRLISLSEELSRIPRLKKLTKMKKGTENIVFINLPHDFMDDLRIYVPEELPDGTEQIPVPSARDWESKKKIYYPKKRVLKKST